MNAATERADGEGGRDPYIGAAEGGPAESIGPRVHDPERRRQFRLRTLMLAIALTAVWMGLLHDPILGPPVLGCLVWFGATLILTAAAMGLGLLGFGLCMAVEHLLGWLRRAARWPEE